MINISAKSRAHKNSLTMVLWLEKLEIQELVNIQNETELQLYFFLENKITPPYIDTYNSAFKRLRHKTL